MTYQNSDIIHVQQSISKYLNSLFDLIEMQNSAGNYSLNKASENIFRDIFNCIYDYNLTNTNLNISNYPAVDLVGSMDSRICYQVTVTNDIKKIKDTLDIFFKKELYKDYDTINFIILKSAKNYNKLSFENYYLELLKTYGIANYNFDVKKNIIDSNYMYSLIVNLLDINKLIQVDSLLEAYFGEKKEQTVLSKYYESLKNEFYEVILEDTKGMTLSDIYIDPEYQYYKPHLVDGSYNLEHSFHSDFVDIKNNKSNIIEAFLTDDFAYLGKIFHKSQHNVLFILGYPGQGKTSFCKKLINNHLKSNSDLPIFYLKLRNINNTKALIENPLKIIQEELAEEVEQELSKATLKKSIIILDGLDELYMKDNMKADDIERFCKELIRECQRLKYNKVIVTTRYGYIDLKRIYENGFIALSLRTLTFIQQQEWLNKYTLFHPETLLTSEMLTKFNDRQKNLNYIRELINQPLLLYIIASLNIELTEDTHRAEIYNLLFDQIIERKYSKDGQIEILKHLKKEDLRALLHEIAYLIFISGKEYVTEAELLNAYVVKEYILQIANDNLAGTLKGVLVSFYFKETKNNELNSKSDTGIEFLHKSLQEYLAAEKIVEDLFVNLIDKDSKGRYIIKQDLAILEWLNNLFGMQPLTDEIAGYVSDMIRKKSIDKKSELAIRLSENLQYFVEKDFLYKMEIHEKDPIEKILAIFQSYWLVLSLTEQKSNYLKSSSISSKINFYFNSLASNRIQTYGVYISSQVFDNAYVKFLSSVYEDNITNVSFKNSHIMADNIMFKQLSNVDFINCEIYDFEFFQSVLKNCKFENTSLYNVELFLVEFINVQFKDCKINSCKSSIGNGNVKGYNSKKLLFINTIFDQESYDTFKGSKFNSKFKNCKIIVEANKFKLIE